MKRKLFLFLTLLVFGGLLTATTTAQETETLVIGSFFPVDSVSGWEGLVEGFQEEHPNVEIEVQVTTGDDYLPKLLTQIVGGDAPDVVSVNNNVFPQFVNRGILANLNPYLEETEGFSKQDFFPHIMDRYTYDSTIYGIPYDAQPFAMLFYNPTLFDEAGLSYPTNDWTYDDMLEAAQALTIRADDGTITQYGYVSNPRFPEYYIYGFGGQLVDDLRNPTESLINSPDAQEGLRFMVDLMYEYEVMPSVELMSSIGRNGHREMFANEQIAMLVNGYWDSVARADNFAELGIQVALAPVEDPENRTYPTGGTAYGIMEASDNKDLAWEFITLFLGLPGYQAAYEAAAQNAIYPPAHIPSYDWFEEQPISHVDTLEPNRIALEYARFAPFALNWNEIEANCIDGPMDLIVRNDLPVDEGLDQIDACIENELEG